MPIETEIQPFLNWFPSGLLYWLLAAATLVVAGVLIGWLLAAVRKGPVVALGETARVFAGGAADLVRISPRRVWALAWLAVRESIRGRVLVVFAVFILILLFAGWFLNPGSSHPARLYLQFVLTTTSYLVLALALFLSTLSLPADIKGQTLHTVVTKPVRPSEVVLGRILGCTAVGTLLLVIMGLCFYPFVTRLLSHQHQLAPAHLTQIEKSWGTQLEGPPREALAGGPGTRLKLATDSEKGHQHDLYVDRNFAQAAITELKAELETKDRQKAEQNLRGKGWRKTKEGWLAQGRLQTETARNHWHEFSCSITADDAGNLLRSKVQPESGSPQGMLVARVPIYGKLRFTDRDGSPGKGVNTGDEWTYRSFIEGGTLQSAIWAFEGIHEERFPSSQPEFAKGLPLEMTIEVFRTYKGKTDDPAGIPGIVGSLAVRNPKTGLKVDARIFEAKEFTTDVRYIPYQLQTPDGRTLDLFQDLVADGEVEVWLRCAESAQYFGAAQPDVYFRARNASFPLNYAKGYLGIWLQMVILIGLGVTFSTFLSGPIALLATAVVALAGLVVDFISRLAAGLVPGGGPVEALIRLLTHQNVTGEMESGLRTTVARMFDAVANFLLLLVAKILPPFGQFSFADYVAYGYDVSANLALQSACRAAAFLLPVFVAGYFFLKLREIAK